MKRGMPITIFEFQTPQNRALPTKPGPAHPLCDSHSLRLTIPPVIAPTTVGTS